MSVTLKIDSSALQKAVQKVDELRGAVTGDAVRAAMGAALRLTLINHFAELQSDTFHHRTATRLGSTPTGFYAAAASGTQVPQVEGDGVSVTVSKQGLMQRWLGGPIFPGAGKKWLAIPAIAAAYGKRALAFGNLHFVPLGPELAALKDPSGDVWYWLKKQVTQFADPTVLPTEEEMITAAARAGEKTVATLWERQS